MRFSSRTIFFLTAFFSFVINAFYSAWTYTQTDPNLVISSWPPYWNTQLWLWQLPDAFVTHLYVLLIILMFISYGLMLGILHSLHISLKTLLIIAIVVALPLVFSNNALSHDVFNYMFNAKMVLKYGANPHVKVALDFRYDDWLRFMHNVHTPAPYFYGWTVMSLFPYALGMGKFVITWTLFRLWSMLGWVLSLIFVGLILIKTQSKNRWAWAVLAFNPLLMIELVSNAHNDAWMMWPALASFWLIYPQKNKISLWKIAISLALLLISASTKYITLALLPVWGILFLFPSGWSFLQSQASSLQKRGSAFHRKFIERIVQITGQFTIFDLSALILFLPLLTSRSQYFHPWYLTWSLAFFPLMKNKWFKTFLVALSLSSLLRYIPWLLSGGFGYTDQIIAQERYITWSIGIAVFVLMASIIQFNIKQVKN